MEKKYTRETQRLIYWLISDIANFWNGKEVGTTPTEYEIYKTKQILKKEYIKVIGYNVPNKPLDAYLDLLNQKDNKSIDELKRGFILALKEFLLLNNDFSLSLDLMTQKNANKFVKYLFELALDNNIPLRKEIATLYATQELHDFVYILLLKKQCAVCGEVAELDHWENVARIGGYKFDDGLVLSYLPLCRKHHTEKHNIGREEFKKRYHIEGIKLNSKEVEVLKNVYKNHFRAYEKGEQK